MIEVRELTKRYGSQRAVDGISFFCPQGSVTGFLGPNGAGKSTTLRMICGLTPPTGGSATVAGVCFTELPDPPRVAGVLLDAGAQHRGRTGREALVLAAATLGLPRSRADELLDLVGLSRADARKRLKGYSLGMRQRLGIAQALVGRPSVLILDEPANGLDPEGIGWMRELLRAFADDGGTVLLSSHLLREVQAVADRLVIIRRGEVVAAGETGGLLGGGESLVRAGDEQALRAALAAARLEVVAREEGALHVRADTAAVGRAAAAAGVALTELRPQALELERLFLELTR